MTEIDIFYDRNVKDFSTMDIDSVGLIIRGKFEAHGTNKLAILYQEYVLKTQTEDGTPVLKIIEIDSGVVSSISGDSYVPIPNSPPVPIFIFPRNFISKFE